mmetsp:Transcript_120681/g.209526  ORF Transcript_120681/g.209526 Transcript_120681/m.209526 type:complete len:169 (-) Transcript_120681:110-616(-)
MSARKSRSIFYPSGPITASHTKSREGLLEVEKKVSQLTHVPLVWSKSGPPTHESRNRSNTGEPLPPLIDAKHPARLAGKAIVELRRDLNLLSRDARQGHPGELSTVACILTPGNIQKNKRQVQASEFDDLSDDELWESIGVPTGVSRAELKKKAISSLTKERCLDVKP